MCCSTIIRPVGLIPVAPDAAASRRQAWQGAQSAPLHPLSGAIDRLAPSGEEGAAQARRRIVANRRRHGRRSATE